MNEDWRFSAKSVTKYNPIYRDNEGHYTKDEWIGFFQIGKQFEDGVLTFEKYTEVERKYIEAAELFFNFHECDAILIHGLEKYGFDEYDHPDKNELEFFFKNIKEGSVIETKSLGTLVKLILREILWAECFCKNDNQVVLRFSYDLYMYFNSSKNMNSLYSQIEEIGLYVL
jgi:hypothetical protein